jgi:hypothetical protein
MASPRHKSRCILAAVDLSGESAAVVRAAVGICGALDRPLCLFHVIEDGLVQRMADVREFSIAEARREALIRARRLLERLAEEAGAPAHTRIYLSVGAAVPRILSWTERLRPHVLVLGEPLLSVSTTALTPLETRGSLGAATRVLLVSDGLGARDSATVAPEQIYQATRPV